MKQICFLLLGINCRESTGGHNMDLSQLKGHISSILVCILLAFIASSKSEHHSKSTCQAIGAKENNRLIDIRASKGVKGVVVKTLRTTRVFGIKPEDRLEECVKECCKNAKCTSASVLEKNTGNTQTNCELVQCKPIGKCIWKISKGHLSTRVVRRIQDERSHPVAHKAEATTRSTTVRLKTTKQVTTTTTIKTTSSTTKRPTPKATEPSPTSTTSAATKHRPRTTLKSKIFQQKTGTTPSTTHQKAAPTVRSTQSPSTAQRRTAKPTLVQSSTKKPKAKPTTTPSPTFPSTTPSSTPAKTPRPKARMSSTPTVKKTPTLSSTTSQTVSPRPKSRSTKKGRAPTPAPTRGAGKSQETGSKGQDIRPSDTLKNKTVEYRDRHIGLYDDQRVQARSNTKAALIAALVFGSLFTISVIVLVGRRVYDSWQRRHYRKVDYLIEGMYA